MGQQRQCPSGRYWRGTELCGCSFASNCGWISRGVGFRGDGAGASRPGAVTPRRRRGGGSSGLCGHNGGLLQPHLHLLDKTRQSRPRPSRIPGNTGLDRAGRQTPPTPLTRLYRLSKLAKLHRLARLGSWLNAAGSQSNHSPLWLFG